MEIICSEAAVQAIQRKADLDRTIIKLVYDTEGCGCAVNGVPQLWVVNQTDPYDRITPPKPIPIGYDAHQEIFFEESMLLDFNPNTQSFILKSKHQIYHADMQLVNKTKSDHFEFRSGGQDESDI